LGIGDQLIGTGLARGAAARGKRIAFGDGRQILWDQHSAMIFHGNPNVARPGSEGAKDLEWIPFYKGNRIYNRPGGDRWIWNYEFKPKPGEIFLDAIELAHGRRYGKDFVLVEPSMLQWKTYAANKDWGRDNFQAVVDRLRAAGETVLQFKFKRGAEMLKGAMKARTLSFREAMGVLKNAKLYIGPEGGMHHAAAALGIPAVVIFGGWIPPSVTGYDMHANITGSDAHFCGSF
jgi:ADP-heptose:LPS heptosyltransferase